MQIPLAAGSRQREVGKFPPILTQNMFGELDPATNIVSLLQRPALDPFAVAGSGPVRGVLQKAGLFGGDTLILSGQKLYRVAASSAVTAFTGTVPGSARVKMDSGPDADGASEARIATGSAIFLAKADMTVAAEDFPDAAGVTDVMYLRGFWVAIRSDTQQLYSRVPGDTTWDALTFTSAEYQPDKAVGLGRVGDTVLVFGETSMEPFALTGTALNPLAPYTGSAEDVGCRNKDTIVALAGMAFSVGDDCAVYKFSPSKTVVSDNGIAERIRRAGSADLRAWGFKLDQHAFYVLTTSRETLVYDDSRPSWFVWSSKGFDFWRAHLGADISGRIIAADALPNSGQIWRLNLDGMSDDGDEIECIATAYLPMPEGNQVCANLVLDCARGEAPLGT